ncbi:MAG: NUDIX domain-containing protein [Reinekea sp.]|jgi:ADP-ribose pyrophosphatase
MKRETDTFKYSIDQTEALYHGFYQMNKLTVTHQKFDGGNITIERELFDRHDAVCVLLADIKHKQFVLIEQFRIGALQEDNPWLIELVAGLIDKDEQPEEVARREAIEEAGIELGRIHFITRYLPSAGGSNERIHLYVAEADCSKASGIHGLDEEGEDIRVLTVPFDQAFTWVEEGQINNAAAIIALQWFRLNQETLKQLWA